MSSAEVLQGGLDLLAVALLALGIKGLSKIRSARAANRLAASAMGLAVVGLLINAHPTAVTWIWIAGGTAVGGVLGALTARLVPMTAMPETVALFNGCGGLSSLLVALGVMLAAKGEGLTPSLLVLISVGLSVVVG
ncbi:MAG: NAD(P)(+) transhydrogenase (Re/Si-specific) subunit beta, partial [Cyanobacteria bacterium MAG APA_bin_95]|nr:NAD(P)(+) transhydrogenase (Re/Si-specific) subunit beta [Cyanobacteria bacterium MAG APA_bin_95]